MVAHVAVQQLERRVRVPGGDRDAGFRRAPVPDRQLGGIFAALQETYADHLVQPVHIVEAVVIDVHHLLFENELHAMDIDIRPSFLLAPFPDLARRIVNRRRRKRHRRLEHAFRDEPRSEKQNRHVILKISVPELFADDHEFVRTRWEGAVRARILHEILAHLPEELHRHPLMSGLILGEIVESVRHGDAHGCRGELIHDKIVLHIDGIREESDRQSALLRGVDIPILALIGICDEEIRRAAADPLHLVQHEVVKADERRHVRDIGEVLAEEPLEQVGHLDRAKPHLAGGVEEVLEEGLHGRHGKSRRRPVPLDVPQNIKAGIASERDHLVDVSADDLLRLPPGRVEGLVVNIRAHRQHAVLDVRRQLQGALGLLHLTLDEALHATRGDDLLNALEKDLRPHGLREIVAQGVGHDALEEAAAFLGVERGHEEERHGLVQLAHEIAEIESVHVAHHDVGDHRAEGMRMLLEDLHGLIHRRGLHRHIACGLQRGGDHQPDEPLVIHHEDGRLVMQIQREGGLGGTPRALRQRLHCRCV